MLDFALTSIGLVSLTYDPNRFVWNSELIDRVLVKFSAADLRARFVLNKICLIESFSQCLV